MKKRGPGRPIGPGRMHVQVTFTPADMRRVEAAAKAADLPVGTWIRGLVLGALAGKDGGK